MYCRRCDDAVEFIAPWRGWKTARLAWWGGVLALAILSPILGADYFCMIPSSFAFIFAGGTIQRLATEKPICRVCSLPLDPGRDAGTGVRPRAGAEALTHGSR
jgi:hypothetical protein